MARDLRQTGNLNESNNEVNFVPTRIEATDNVTGETTSTYVGNGENADVLQNWYNAGGSGTNAYDLQVDYDNNGNWTRQQDKVSITLDKNTGDINVEAPDYLLNRDNFEDVIDMDGLKKLSSDYKTNKDTKYPNIVQDSEGNSQTLVKGAGDEVSVEQLVEQRSKELKETIAPAAKQFQQQKDILSARFGSENVNDEFTRNYLNNTAVGSGVTDDSVQSLPDFENVYTKNYFEGDTIADALREKQKELGRTDLTKKELLEVYSRTKHSGEDLYSFNNKLDQFINSATVGSTKEVDANGNMVDKLNDDFMNQVGKALSLRTFTKNTGPTNDFWSASTDVIKSVAESIFYKFEDLAVGTAILGANVAGFRDDDVSRTLERAYRNQKQQQEDQYNMFSNSNSFAGATWNIGSAIGEVATFLIPGGAISKGVTTAGKVAAEIGAKLAEKAAVRAGGKAFVRDMERKASQKVMNLSSKKLAEGAVKNVSMTLKTLPEKAANNLISGAIKTSEALAKGTSKALSSNIAAGVIRAGAEVVSDSVITATVQDPIAARNFLSGTASDKEKQFLMEQMAWSIGGYGGVKALGWAGGKVAKTTSYQKINIALSQRINGLESSISTWKNNTKLAQKRMERLVNKKDNPQSSTYKVSRVENKIQTRKTNRALTEQKREFANIRGIFKDDAQFQKARDAKIKLQRLQNRVDTIQRGPGGTVRRFFTNKRTAPLLSPLNKSLDDKATKILRLEKSEIKAAGGKWEKGEKVILNNGKASRIFSKETSNYIGSIAQKPVFENRLRVATARGDKQEIAGIKKSLDELNDNITRYEKQASPELQQAARDYMETNRIWNYEIENTKVAMGLRSETELQSLRQSGLTDEDIQALRDKGMSEEDIKGITENGIFGKDGELYMHTQRQAEYDEAVKRRVTGETKRQSDIREYSYSKNSTGDFADPQLVRYDQMMEAASVYDQNNYARALLSSQGAQAELIASGPQTAAQKVYKDTQKKAEKEIQKQGAKISDQFAGQEGMDDFIAAKIGEKKVIKADNALQQAQYKQATAKNSTATAARSSQYVNGMPDEDVKAVFQNSYGINSIDDLLYTKDGFDAAIEGGIIPPSSQKFLQNKIKNYLAQANPDAIKPGKKILTFENYQAMRGTTKKELMQTDAIINDLDRHIISTDKALRENSIVKDAVTKEMQNEQDRLAKQAVMSAEKELDDTTQKVLGIDAETYNRDKEQLYKARNEFADNMIDDWVDEFMRHGGSPRKNLSSAMKMMDLEASDTELTYAALDTILKRQKETIRKEVMDKTRAELSRRYPKATTTEVNRLSKQYANFVVNKLESRRNSIRVELGSTHPLVDSKAWSKEVSAEMDNLMAESMNTPGAKPKDAMSAFRKEANKKSKEITDGMNSLSDHIGIRNSGGDVELYSTSPLVADLANYRASYVKPGGLTGTLQGINYVWSKLFRLGTTGVRVSSIISQTFRDTINAWMGGGLHKTIKTCAKDLEDVFGVSPMKYFAQFDTAEQRAIKAIAKESGEPLEKAMAQYSVSTGRAISPAATETQAYRLSPEMTNRLFNAIDNASEKLSIANTAREKYLRNLTYSNGFSQAIKEGYTVSQAKEFAAFVQSNATTNFSRTMTHLSAFQQTVPYLGAAVNGTKSFYRLFSMDPVGVMGRMTAGLAVPTMALTAMSLSDERNREVWKNIPEYMKDDNLIFVVDGQLFTIPLPQEISNVIAPFRQFVEELYGANKHSFWQLAASDIIGLSPIELSGFIDLDAANLLEDPSQIFNAGKGISRVFSQLAPPPIKAAAMYVTETDPYTGKHVYKNRVYADPDTNEQIVMDSTQNAFAQWFANTFGNVFGSNWCSAEMAAFILPQIVGQAGVDALNTVTNLAAHITSGGEKGDALYGAKALGENIAKPLTGTVYNQADFAWKSTVSELYNIKNELYDQNTKNGQMFASMNTNINKETDPNKKAQLIAQKNEWLQDVFYSKVNTAINNLQAKYGDTAFDKNKYAAVINLMAISPTQDINNAKSGQQSSEAFYEARNKAVRTMVDMGFKSTQDPGVFGYMKYNKTTGEMQATMATPLGIMNSQNIVKGASSQHEANIKSILKSAGLDSTDAVWAQLNSIKGSGKNGKMTSADYNKKDAVKLQWNAKVMEALYPYVSKYGVDNVLSNKVVYEQLRNTILVPSTYQKLNNGRYFSASDMDKQAAFIRSYVKKSFANMDKEKKK